MSKAVYTGKTHTTGGRDGTARSPDGRLDVKLSHFASARMGTNPEQLFAAGWSACFLGAVGKAAAEQHIHLPADAAVDAEIDLVLGDDGYGLYARLKVILPGLAAETAATLVERAHQLCPYSKATRRNIGVELSVA